MSIASKPPSFNSLQYLVANKSWIIHTDNVAYVGTWAARYQGGQTQDMRNATRATYPVRLGTRCQNIYIIYMLWTFEGSLTN